MGVFKIKLKDGTQYTLADSAIGSQFTIVFPDRAAFNAAWDRMDYSENLDEVEVTVDDEPLTVIRNLVLDGAQATYNVGEMVTGHFYFHGAEYSRVESEYIEVARILLGEE